MPSYNSLPVSQWDRNCDLHLVFQPITKQLTKICFVIGWNISRRSEISLYWLSGSRLFKLIYENFCKLVKKANKNTLQWQHLCWNDYKNLAIINLNSKCSYWNNMWRIRLWRLVFLLHCRKSMWGVGRCLQWQWPMHGQSLVWSIQLWYHIQFYTLQ